MEQHLAVLLDRARDPKRSADDRYVWWGKVRSGNRLQGQRHTDDILAIGEAIKADEAEANEVQLYLTDYRSLYVGLLADMIQTHTKFS